MPPRALARTFLRLAAGLALAATTTACASTNDIVLQPARSTRGRMGFGQTSTIQTQFGGSISSSRTGVAGASAAGVEPGGGDWVWRVTQAGARLELCHAGWASRSCRTALFDGAPNPIPPFLKFATYPILIDPVNLGRVLVVSTDTQGNVWTFGSLRTSEVTVPVTPGYGVWALGGGGALHHCRLEGETPRCRVAKTPEGTPIAGLPLSLKTYGDSPREPREGGAEREEAPRTGLREGAWFTGGLPVQIPGFVTTGGGLFHCEVESDKTEPPVCRPAKMGSETFVFKGWSPSSLVLSSHVVARDGVPYHVVWFQIEEGEIVRCQARGGEAPSCAIAKKE